MIGAVALYVLYRFLRRPVVTGSPREMPKVVRRVEESIEKAAHKLEEVTTKIIHPHKATRKEGAQTDSHASAAGPPTDGAVPHPDQPAPEPGAQRPPA